LGGKFYNAAKGEGGSGHQKAQEASLEQDTAGDITRKESRNARAHFLRIGKTGTKMASVCIAKKLRVHRPMIIQKGDVN
jgi:hypothetical protein